MANDAVYSCTLQLAADHVKLWAKLKLLNLALRSCRRTLEPGSVFGVPAGSQDQCAAILVLRGLSALGLHHRICSRLCGQFILY